MLLPVRDCNDPCFPFHSLLLDPSDRSMQHGSWEHTALHPQICFSNLHPSLYTPVGFPAYCPHHLVAQPRHPSLGLCYLRESKPQNPNPTRDVSQAAALVAVVGRPVGVSELGEPERVYMVRRLAFPAPPPPSPPMVWSATGGGGLACAETGGWGDAGGVVLSGGGHASPSQAVFPTT